MASRLSEAFLAQTIPYNERRQLKKYLYESKSHLSGEF
jgi:hypothetical protein